MFKADEEELLELNRKNYPTLSSLSRMVHGSPVELPRIDSEGLQGRGTMHVLKLKRRKEAFVYEEWLDVEVFASSHLHARSQAVLLYRSFPFFAFAPLRQSRIKLCRIFNLATLLRDEPHNLPLACNLWTAKCVQAEWAHVRCVTGQMDSTYCGVQEALCRLQTFASWPATTKKNRAIPS